MDLYFKVYPELQMAPDFLRIFGILMSLINTPLMCNGLVTFLVVR